MNRFKKQRIAAREEAYIISEEFEAYYDEIILDSVKRLEKYFSRRRLRGIPEFSSYYEPNREFFTAVLLDPQMLINLVTLRYAYEAEKAVSAYSNVLTRMSGKIRALYTKYGKRIMREMVSSEVSSKITNSKFLKDISDHFPSERLAGLFKQNYKYSRVVDAAYRHIRVLKMLSREFLDSVPDNYAMLYPEARAIDRHFIIHTGGTNSGKTFDAIERLRNAKKGIYLAPLRLLAYEQYEKLTELGVKCSMITGEERIIVPDATHQASTIEMLDLKERYDLAVIDEAQMAADPDRGGAWTSAILGIQADEIHVCCSENALNCIVKMIESCGDTYEVVEHKRMTPLITEKTGYRYPKDVMDGDALIVFSRRDVHACAADLVSRGKKCSVIYGNLPYDVRHAEAEKFARGETKVVVSTDAIGMGMNLPIRRIVFLRTEKFDGHTSRELVSTEVKQIAGRAGRYGIYDTGYVTSIVNLSGIRSALLCNDPQIEKAVIDIPSIFFEKEGRISEILAAWDSLPATRDYEKSNILEMIDLARELEEVSGNKERIREFVSIPIDAGNKEVHRLWMELFLCLEQGQAADLKFLFTRFDPDAVKEDPKSAETLETYYKIFDLLFAYAVKHGTEEDLKTIAGIKSRISDKLNAILKKQIFQGKTCRECGRKLSWLYPYGICGNCFRRRRFA